MTEAKLIWGHGSPAPGLLGADAAALPQGCVRDIDHANLEHRRIKFAGQGPFTITTDLVHSPDKTKPQPYNKFVADPQASLSFIGFNKYLKPDHTVDWDATDGRPRHTCVRVANGHGQLWELNNPTDEMHNFHIHQTKFRSATFPWTWQPPLRFRY
jgi:FtsP/CotA-like multicopper oxidase with cupredoxin domain